MENETHICQLLTVTLISTFVQLEPRTADLFDKQYEVQYNRISKSTCVRNTIIKKIYETVIANVQRRHAVGTRTGEFG